MNVEEKKMNVQKLFFQAFRNGEVQKLWIDSMFYGPNARADRPTRAAAQSQEDTTWAIRPITLTAH